MKCKVYPSTKKHNRYIIVPSQNNLVNLADGAKNEIGKNKFWKEIHLDSNSILIGLDSDEAIKNINNKGYHIQEVSFLFEEKR